jgi:hypothetical protein
MAFLVNEDRFIPALKDMTNPMMPLVELLCIDTVYTASSLVRGSHLGFRLLCDSGCSSDSTHGKANCIVYLPSEVCPEILSGLPSSLNIGFLALPLEVI